MLCAERGRAAYAELAEVRVLASLVDRRRRGCKFDMVSNAVFDIADVFEHNDANKIDDDGIEAVSNSISHRLVEGVQHRLIRRCERLIKT